MRWSLLLLILFEAYRTAAGQPQRDFPFEFRDGFIWVKVVVSGAPEPLQMLLDSGAEVSTLNVDTAKRLRLEGGRRVTVLGVGSKGTGRWPVRLHGRIEDIAIPDQFLVADLCEVQEICQCPVDGLLGADFFWDKIVQIDFAAKRVRVMESAPRQGKRVPIQFRRKIMQVPVGVGGEGQQWVRLDTGCATAVEWVSRGKKQKSLNRKVSIALAELHLPTVRETVRMGESRFENISVGVHERAFFASEGGLLGLGFLGQFERITIDSKGRQLFLSGKR